MIERRISLVTAALFICATQAAEKMDKLEVKGSTELVLPKPSQRNINTDRRLKDDADRPGDSITSVAPPRVENSPLLNKKLLHELDKQKNWIFRDPHEDNLDSKTEDFMKGEKGSGLYNNRFMQSDDERTAVQKYLERDRNRDDKDKDKDRDRDSELSDRSREKEGFSSKRDEDDLKEKTGALGEPKAQFDTAIFKAGVGADPFGGSPLDKKQRDPFSDSSFSASKARGFDKEEMRQQQIAHEKEFDSILQSRPGSVASFGRIDTLNPAADVGRLDLGTPSAARRPDPYSIGSRGGGPTTAIFTDGGAPSFGNRNDYGNRSFNDSLPTFGATQPIASFGASPVQVAPERSSALPAAASVQSIPMRKF